MNIPTPGGYSTNFDDAPLDEEVILLIKTGDQDEPLVNSLGYWDEENARWDGDWRNMDAEFAGSDPVAWAPTPEVDDELLAELGIELPEAA